MTFRKDRTPGSFRTGEKSLEASRSSARPAHPAPPGNLDPTLGPVDFDEVEMQSLKVMFQKRRLRQAAERGET
jgi:hypothetical protein